MHPSPAEDPHDPRLRRFEALYRDEHAFVWSAARHLGVPVGSIDEVVQDVFLTAHRRLDHLRYEVSPRAWLYGVTRRVAFRYRRGAARRARRLANFAELPRQAPGAPQQRHDDAEQLARLLERLGEGTRRVWELTELLGMSAPEIASELGLPLNTVYSRLRLARSQLQAPPPPPDRPHAWRAAARRAHAPPQGAQQRSWALLLPVLGNHGAAAVGVVAWAKSQAGLATVWITLGVAAVGLAVTQAPSPPPGPAASSSSSSSSSSSPAPPSLRAPPPPPPTAPSTPPPAATPPQPRRNLSPRTAPDDARLAEEIRLIDRVHAQLAAHDPDAALATIDEHARRFPAGTLVDVRDAARISALCARGDAPTAEAAAARLLARDPTSAVAQRFENYRCPR